MRRIIILIFTFISVLSVYAQDWLNVHYRNAGVDCIIPFRIGQMKEMRVDEFQSVLMMDVAAPEGHGDQQLSFSMEEIDSLTFSYDLPDSLKGHDKYRVFTLHIHTVDAQPVKEKEVWVDCHFSLDGMGEYNHYSGTGCIRGRGNSTWDWYDKKPYKFKLDEKSKLLGLEKARNWNLMANYRDVTDLMNAFAFEVARCLGMPYTNHTRFVEVFLNDEYVGLYQLTEKIEVGRNRVNIDEEGGLLLSFDLDDGPSLSPDADNNFSSRIYGLPVCVKYPKDPSAALLDSVRKELAVIEKAILQHNYLLVDSLVDIPSFIGILQMHEYLYNVEMDAPRSIYAYRDKGGKLTFGPAWDWDAGYDFDWSNMYTGHRFFTDYRELLFGTTPATHGGAAYSVSGFWTDMFQDSDFVSLYKAQWQSVRDTLLTYAWGEMERYLKHLREGAYERDIVRWPINGMNVDTEVDKMHQWLTNRLSYINKVVDAYPAGSPYVPSDNSDDDNEEYSIVNGELVVNRTLQFSHGYDQAGSIELPKEVVSELMGGTPTSLVPLNVDGSKGSNTAAGRYGAWFDEQGNTNPWAWGHVYIESDNLYVWRYGCHPDNCQPGHTHTVRMQFARSGKKLNVTVHFTIL